MEAEAYLRSRKDFIPVPLSLRRRMFVAGLDGREGLYIGNLLIQHERGQEAYSCVLIMDDGSVWAFHPYSLFNCKRRM